MNQRVKIPIKDINEGDRQRTELGDISALAGSIQRLGLIQPIVVDQHLRLIAGGRRLAACRSLAWETIDAVFREVLTDDELAELELEENVRRKDFTWQEKCTAIARIHHLKQRQATETQSSWGTRETGELFGVSHGKIAFTLKIAHAIENKDKDVLEATSITDALRILLQRREDEAMRLLAQRTTVNLPLHTPPNQSDVLGLTNPVNAPGGSSDGAARLQQIADEVNKRVYVSSHFVRADCREWLKDYANTFDAIITDPPYAIDVEYMQQTAGGLSDINRIAETHQVSDNLDLLEQVMPLLYAALKSNGFAVLWCDIMRWEFLQENAEHAGFSPQRWPIVWHKTSPCINQCANKNFTKNVEFAIVLRKGNAVLARPATSCVISASNAEKLYSHPFTKPPEVWRFIAQHVCIANSMIGEPFAGVGSAVIPLLEMGHRVIGCEVDETHHAHLLENVKQWHLSKRPDCEFV